MDANMSGLRWNIPEGTEVVDAGGEGLGQVVANRPGLIVVEKGRIFPSDLYIPRAEIADFDGGRVRLTVHKDEISARRWDREPGTEPYDDVEVAADPAVGMPGAAGTGAPGLVEDPDSDRTSGTANRATLDRSN